jgi:hypothetical protein
MLQAPRKKEGHDVGCLHVATLMTSSRDRGRKPYKPEKRHRGDFPSPEHLEVSAGEQDLPVSPAEGPGGGSQPGLGDGHHLRATSARLRLSGGDG